MIRSFTRRAFVALFGATTLAGCEHRPEPGEPCKPADIRCLDPHTELACQNGFFIAAPCKGPKGCQEGDKQLTCDFSGNAAGDVCSTGDEGNARCLADRKRRIACRAGKYVIENCRGRQGCRTEAGKRACDQSISVIGDPCAGKAHACSADGKAVLECRDGRFEEQARCEGRGGCTVLDGKISCDQRERETSG